MKQLFTILMITFWTTHFLNAQPILWQHSMGGTAKEVGNHIAPTSDGGYISVSTSFSTDGDVLGGLQGPHGGSDIFVVKMSSTNVVQWKRCIGGTMDELASTVNVLPSGEFVVIGQTNSTGGSGDIDASKAGGIDVCVFKLSASGAIVWSKCFGTASGDETISDYSSAALATDGNIVMVANTSIGHDGIGINNPGGNPGGWLFKINVSTGAKMWEKLISGSWADQMFAVSTMTDGSYVVCGVGGSPDIPTAVPPIPKGQTDMIVSKVNSAGTIVVWSRMYGGSDAYDGGHGVTVSGDGTIYAVGNVMSTDGDCIDKHGGVWLSDAFVVAIDPNGNKLWSNCVGGDGSFDVLVSAHYDADNNPLLSGWINGSGGDVSNYFGFEDAWIIKLNKSNGAILNEKSYGGSGQERSYCVVDVAGNYLQTGFSTTVGGHVTSNNGAEDSWTFQTGAIPLPITSLTFTGITLENTNRLFWRTIEEKNSKQFLVQRSADAIHFETVSIIGSQATPGNSNTVLEYSYTDIQPLLYKNYYRLVQEDIDGKRTFSSILELVMPTQSHFMIYPNPMNGTMMYIVSDKNMEYSLSDITGRIIQVGEIVKDKNCIPIDALPQGTYLLKAGDRVHKLIKK